MLVTRQPIVVEDVTDDLRFARDAAESTGYVPRGLMAVPLLHDERALGVLQVLDRPQDARFTLAEMDVLALFANQAAIALDLLQHARRAAAALESEEDESATVSRLAGLLDGLEGADREAGIRLVEALNDLLRPALGHEKGRSGGR